MPNDTKLRLSRRFLKILRHRLISAIVFVMNAVLVEKNKTDDICIAMSTCCTETYGLKNTGPYQVV